MANWEKLNQKFDQVLDSMTDADWDNWAKDREMKRQMRKQKMILKARLQQEKIALAKSNGDILLRSKVYSVESSSVNSQDFSVSNGIAGEYNYAFAA